MYERTAQEILIVLKSIDTSLAKIADTLEVKLPMVQVETDYTKRQETLDTLIREINKGLKNG